MKSKNKFKIGEFSRLCFVTVKTLRHYEKMGLLKPMEVDSWTGYRYYGVEQMEELHHILELKRIGLSLEEIRDLIEEGSDSPSVAMLEKALCKAQDEMSRVRDRIVALQRMIDSPQKKYNMSNITIKPLPRRLLQKKRTGSALLVSVCRSLSWKQGKSRAVVASVCRVG